MLAGKDHLPFYFLKFERLFVCFDQLLKMYFHNVFVCCKVSNGVKASNFAVDPGIYRRSI